MSLLITVRQNEVQVVGRVNGEVNELDLSKSPKLRFPAPMWKKA